MKLTMKDGVLTVEGNGEVIDVAIINDELEVFGNVVVEEVEEEKEEKEEAIEFPDEPDMPTDSKAHYRTEHYPLIKGLKVGDKVKLRLDLDEDLDEIESIALYDNYDCMLLELGEGDLTIGNIVDNYDEVSNRDEDCLEIRGWFLSTRWVTKVEE